MKTEFNFNSQVCTDKNQSERLLALGLKKETADMVWIPEVDFDAEGEPYDTENYFERPIEGVWDYALLEGIPAWSLHRLMSLCFNSGATHVELFEDDDAYEILIYKIEMRIKEDYFAEEYLV